MTRKLTLFLICLATITACKKSGNTDNPEKKDPGKALVLTTTEQQQVGPGNAFTLKLFKENANTIGSNQNLIVSPLSVSFAVGMTSNGAAGQTLADMRKTMEFDGFTEDQVNTYHQNLITNLPQLDPNTTIKIANSIWYANSFTPLPQFLKTNTDFYNAEIQSLNFNDKAASLNTINNWVSQQTNNKIPKILDQMPDGARLFLINAIYFKSAWKTRFDTRQTYKSLFRLADNSTIQTDFMTARSVELKTAYDNGTNIVELPYSNDRYSMLLIMPDTDLKGYINTLDQTKWDLLMNKLTATKSQITIPKFKFSYEAELKSILTSMGMGAAFSDLADFSRINAGGGLKIGEVKHKAYIDVNEDGTEAAAVTEVGIIVTAPAPTNVYNKPFIFAIREMKTGLILFTGVVNNPTLGE